MEKMTLEKFLEVCGQFQLGQLPTEQSHPLTTNLDKLSVHHLAEAIEVFRQVDLLALGSLQSKAAFFQQLSSQLKETLELGGRIFLCGCGATGRLSIALEKIWRDIPGNPYLDRVISFMAGGDAALISSIENFEDFPAFGARQLEELGAKKADLFIGITEGGETPFVIGATEYAAQIGCKTFFLFCNPQEILSETLERSKNVFTNSKIISQAIETGPMALSGSTRLQASTVLMYGVGLAMLGVFEWDSSYVENRLRLFIRRYKSADFSNLQQFISKEASIYQRGDWINYLSDSNIAITILTDTTERSPTFSLHSFENKKQGEDMNSSLSYLFLPEFSDASSALNSLLGRSPRSLDWDELGLKRGNVWLEGFDFSREGLKWRCRRLGAENCHSIRVELAEQKLKMQFEDIQFHTSLDGFNLLESHIFLKLILNMHSTLLMGRLGRYSSNLMTWVRPSNFKLIDRAIRYVMILLEKEGIDFTYHQVATVLFEQIKQSGPIVVNTVEAVKKKLRKAELNY